MRVAWNRASEQRRSRVKAAYVADQATVEEIAREFDMDPATIQKWARQDGWPRRHPSCVTGQRARFARERAGEGAMA